MRLDYQSPESLAPVVEALIFASDEPVSAVNLRALILGEEILKTDISEPVEATAEEVSSQTATRQNGSQKSSANGEAAVAEDVDTAVGIATNGDPLASGPDGTELGSSDEEQVVVEERTSPTDKKRKKKQLIELVTLHVAVQHLNSIYEQQERSFRIIEIAGGYQFATRPEYSEYVVRLSKEKSRRRLSGASLESLAIIAYKQPVSKIDVENIRGVNCDEVLKSLLEKNLITITGRAEAVGRPLLYGTTVEFLRHFGLHSIGDLPRPREIEELMKEEAVRATTLEEAANEFVSPQDEETGMTVDAAVAVAKELAEREDEVIANEEKESGGIELDEEAMTAMASPDADEDLEIELDETELEAEEELEDEVDEDDVDEDDVDEDDLDEDELDEDEIDDEDFDDEDLEEDLEDEEEQDASNDETSPKHH